MADPTSPKHIIADGIIGTGNGDFEESPIIYHLTDSGQVNGFGEFFSFEASKSIIDTYWKDLEKENEVLEKIEDEQEKLSQDATIIESTLKLDKDQLDTISTALKNKIVAIEIGKEMLLMILSQPGCEGIRFYQARALKASSESDSKYLLDEKDKLTLVAIGMNGKGTDLGVSVKGGDISTLKNVSIMSENAIKATKEAMKSETNPPKTLGELRNPPLIGDPESLEHAFFKMLNKNT